LLRADVPAIHVFSYGNKATARMPGIKPAWRTGGSWWDRLMVRDAPRRVSAR